MQDIPAGWITVITLAFTAFTGGIAWIFKGKREEELRKEGVIVALQAKIDQLQTDKLNMLQQQLDFMQKRRETDDRIARSLEEQSTLLRVKVGAAT
jgi:hypothetical protein